MEPAATEVSSTTITNESPPRGRRGWWQFSLFSLLLLFVIACLIAGYVGQTRRMEEARRELARRDETIKQLRQELGIDEDAKSALTIQDPSKLHVAALPSWEENAWRWKVYLPPGKKWQVGTTILESEGQGKPLRFVGGSAGQINGEGELVLETRLHRELDGTVRVSNRIGTGGNAFGSTYLESQAKSRGSIRQVGHRQQVIAEPGERLEILRRTVMEEPQPVPGKRISVAREKGAVVIYLEEAQPPSAAKKRREKSSQ